MHVNIHCATSHKASSSCHLRLRKKGCAGEEGFLCAQAYPHRTLKRLHVTSTRTRAACRYNTQFITIRYSLNNLNNRGVFTVFCEVTYKTPCDL